MSKTIREWHEEVYNLLMEYRDLHPGFTFAPRTKDDKKGRFRSGLWFQGTEHYLFVGLTALGDSHNKTKTIGFVLNFREGNISRSYIGVAFSDGYNRKHIDYFRKVLDLFGIPFQEGKYKYSKDLPMQEGLRQTLYSFLDQYWNRLHDIMSAQADSAKMLITEDQFKKYIEKRQAVIRRGPISMPAEEAIDNDEDDDVEVEGSFTGIPLNFILYGPPGTGKTYKLRTDFLPLFSSSPEIPDSRKNRLINSSPDTPGTSESRRYELVTFHQSYGYEEFVEGLRPIAEEGSIRYEVVPGTFLRICRRAQLDPKNHYAVLIDEINRGNISRIFGELITLIETDKRVRYDHEGKRIPGDSGLEVRLPYSGSLFGVPANVHIIGTMNTADRSIALLDMALRRRFEFEEVVPDPDLIKGSDGRGWIDTDDGDPLRLPELLGSINRRINYFLGRDLMIGHAYLTKVRDIQDLHEAFAKKIIPLLQEYFYADWEKIRLVVGDHPEQRKHYPDPIRSILDGMEDKQHQFIISKKLAHSKVFGFGSSDQEDPREYRVNPALFDGTLSPWAYRKIYSL